MLTDEQVFAHVVEYADGYGVFVAVCAEAGAAGRGLVRVVWHRVQRGEGRGVRADYFRAFVYLVHSAVGFPELPAGHRVAASLIHAPVGEARYARAAHFYAVSAD